MVPYRNTTAAACVKFSHLLAALLVIAGILAGCAGPARSINGPRTFEQWSREDRGRLALGDLPGERLQAAHRPDSAETDLPADARLDDYVRYAMQHNPDLAAAFYRWRAAVERLPQVRTLPDPRISLALVLDEVDRSAEYMGERYTLEQMFPWFGKLSLDGDMALARSQAEAQRFEAQRLQLVDRVHRAFFEYAFQHHAVAINRENLALLVRLESVVREMFRTGAPGLADLMRIQTEIGRLDDQLRASKDLLGVMAAELNASLGRSVHATLPDVPGPPSMHPIPVLPEQPDDWWLNLARFRSPELAATRHEAREQDHAVDLARRNYYPDITVGLEYARDASARIAMIDEGGTDMLAGMLAVNVPIWRQKYAAGVRESMARHAMANRNLQGRINQLETDLKLALYGHRDSLRKLTLYGDTLLPMARRTLAATETAYRVGSAGFTELIDAQRVLLEFSLAHERAAADRAQTYSRIQALVGGPLDDNRDLDPPQNSSPEPPGPSPAPHERQQR